MGLKKKIIGILHWSEKYTQTDMVYLFSGGFWLTLWEFLHAVSTLVIGIIFANFLSKETYGNYTYIISVSNILAISTLLGTNAAITRAVTQGYNGSLPKVLRTRLKWGALGTFAGIILATYYGIINNNIVLGASFLVCAIFTPLMNSLTLYQGFWAGKKRFDIQAKWDLAIQAVAMTMVIIAVIFTKNLFFAVLAFFISCTIMRLIFAKIILKKSNFNEKEDPNIISYGKHLSFMGIIGTVAIYLDRIIVWQQLGPVSLAVYFFSVAMPQAIEGVLKNIANLALPKFSNHTKESLKKALPSKILMVIFCTVCLVAIYILIAPYIYKILFPQYLESVLYSQVLAIYLIAVSGTHLLNAGLVSQGKTKELYIAKFVPSTVEIILFGVLIPLFGIWGAIYALISSEYLRFFFYLFLFNKI